MAFYMILCYWLIGNIITPSPTVNEKLRKDIFTGYSPMQVPVINQSKAIDVTFNMKVLQVLDIDEIKQKIKIQCYFQVSWVNEYLKWNPREWGNITSLHVHKEKVWIPDILLLNMVDSNEFTIQEITNFVHIDNKGNHYWQPGVMLTASFLADIRYFPFDRQNFTFRYQSWIYVEEKLRILKTDKAIIDPLYVESSQWRIINTEKVFGKYVQGNLAFSDARFTYTFVRLPSFYLTTLLAPCIILIFIWLSSYYLPANSGERMGVIITILLAFAVFLEVVAGSLPRNAHSASYFSIYIITVMCICTLSFFFTCLVITLLHKGTDGDAAEPPVWLNVLVKKSARKPRVPCSASYQNKVSDTEAGNDSEVRKDSDAGYDVETLPQLQKQSVTPTYVGKLKGGKKPSFAWLKLRREKSGLGKELKELKSISKMLKVLTKALKDGEKKEGIQLEWKLIAEVVDRISFWFILISFALSHIPLIIAYDNYH